MAWRAPPNLIFHLVVVATLMLAQPARAEVLVSIYPLQAEGLDADTTAGLDQLLRLQTAQLPGVTLKSRVRTQRSIRRSAGEETGCRGRLRCLVEVGEADRAGLLVFGSAARHDDAYHLDLKVIDVDTEKIARRAEARLAGDAAALASACRDLALRLLVPDQLTGTLAVRMLVPGARVLFDGIEVGVTPLEPLAGLQPRLYTVEVMLEGAEPLRTNVQVRQATITTLRVDLEGERLVGQPEQKSQLEQGPPPTVAHELARRLQAAPLAAPAADAVDPSAQTNVAAPPEPEPLREEEEERVGTPSSLVLTGGSLIGIGALTGLLGAAGIAVWGVGYANASQYVEASGAINDPERFDQARADQAMHVGLGTAGGVGLAVGLAALAGGIGLMMYDLDASDQAALPEVADE